MQTWFHKILQLGCANGYASHCKWIIDTWNQLINKDMRWMMNWKTQHWHIAQDCQICNETWRRLTYLHVPSANEIRIAHQSQLALFTLYQSQTLISTLWLCISSVCFQKRMEGILFWQWPNFWAPISNRSHLFIVDCCTDHPHCIWQLVLWKWSDDRDNIRLWCSIHIGALGRPTQADGGQTQDVHSISP